MTAEVMRAARFDAATGRLAVTEVPVPRPGPAEVLVRVRACGICLSDVHLIDGSLPGPLPVVTPGHEPAGEIAALGADVTGWRVGQRVVMAAGRLCGECAACRAGRFDACRRPQIMGFSYDGAWAQYVVVPFYALTAVPDGIPMEQAAILADAVATPYAGLVDRAQLRPGESVGIWGIGGLGVHAVQIARLLGAAPIIAVDPLASARVRALAARADVALDPADPDLGARVRELTGGAGLDVAADFVGSPAVAAQAAGCAGAGGRILLVGMSLEPPSLPPMVVLNLLGQSVLGHLGYRPAHLDTLVSLVARGRLDVSASVSDTMPLDAVADGVRRLADKEGDPVRLVVLP